MHNLKIAEMSDVSKVVDMCLSFHESSPFHTFPFEVEKVHEFVQGMLASNTKNAIIFLSMDNTTPVGMLLACATECLFSRQKWATELALWVEPKHRSYGRFSELEGAYTYWAKNVAGCKLVSLAALDDQTEKLYHRKGYRLTEQSYSKAL